MLAEEVAITAPRALSRETTRTAAAKPLRGARRRTARRARPRSRSRLGGALAAALAILCASVALAQEAHPATPVRTDVHLVVLSRFPEAWIAPVARALASDLDVRVAVEPSLSLPESAYYAPRHRYRAERLVAFLTDHFRDLPATDRVLGLTAEDISTEAHGFRDWGILGLADIGGRAAVVSSYRMRRRARSPEHALWRMTTTAVHEMGHALGLPHCDEARCVMRDAEGTMDNVDAGDGELGPRCRALLDRTAPRALP